jgi:hypothetical protein
MCAWRERDATIGDEEEVKLVVGEPEVELLLTFLITIARLWCEHHLAW